MVAGDDADTDELVEQARGGDREARQQLLGRHRDRLRQMVALRMDRRLRARVDPSDVVQDALADAAQELSDYLGQRPLPFYLSPRSQLATLNLAATRPAGTESALGACLSRLNASRWRHHQPDNPGPVQKTAWPRTKLQ
jgi:hypothetical protein